MTKSINQSSFGQNAESYARSAVHAQGASLQRMVDLVQPGPDWLALDVATGAGHTAFAFAPHVARVWATDITEEMLALAARGAQERGLKNVIAEYAEAEKLPFPDAHFHLVTCRIAPHHFSSIPDFLSESARVLRPGGTLAVVDNIVPPGPAGAYVNAFEKLRDPSHGRCWSRGEWEDALAARGFEWAAAEELVKAIPFNFWAQRHDADMQSYLHSMLELASGEARDFLAPVFGEDGTQFHLLEGLYVVRKAG